MPISASSAVWYARMPLRDAPTAGIPQDWPGGQYVESERLEFPTTFPADSSNSCAMRSESRRNNKYAFPSVSPPEPAHSMCCQHQRALIRTSVASWIELPFRRSRAPGTAFHRTETQGKYLGSHLQLVLEYRLDPKHEDRAQAIPKMSQTDSRYPAMGRRRSSRCVAFHRNLDALKTIGTYKSERPAVWRPE